MGTVLWSIFQSVDLFLVTGKERPANFVLIAKTLSFFFQPPKYMAPILQSLAPEMLALSKRIRLGYSFGSRPILCWNFEKRNFYFYFYLVQKLWSLTRLGIFIFSLDVRRKPCWCGSRHWYSSIHTHARLVNSPFILVNTRRAKSENVTWPHFNHLCLLQVDSSGERTHAKSIVHTNGESIDWSSMSSICV